MFYRIKVTEIFIFYFASQYPPFLSAQHNVPVLSDFVFAQVTSAYPDCVKYTE